MTLVHRNKSEILRLLNRALRVSFLTLSLLTASMQADAESSALSSDAITQAEEHLERAALDVPQRNKQDTIQRDVQDIVFLLNQSWKATEKSTTLCHALTLTLAGHPRQNPPSKTPKV